MKAAAIYARVSSDQQKQDHTIASQTAALKAFASSHGYAVPDEWIVEDEGFSGATLIRPGLERVRDLVAYKASIKIHDSGRPDLDQGGRVPIAPQQERRSLLSGVAMSRDANKTDRSNEHFGHLATEECRCAVCVKSRRCINELAQHVRPDLDGRRIGNRSQAASNPGQHLLALRPRPLRGLVVASVCLDAAKPSEGAGGGGGGSDVAVLAIDGSAPDWSRPTVVEQPSSVVLNPAFASADGEQSSS